MANADPGNNMKQDIGDEETQDVIMKEEHDADDDMDTIPVAAPVKQERSTSVAVQSGTNTPRTKRQSQSPVKAESMAAMSRSPAIKDDEVKIEGDVELKLDSANQPKLVRKQSQKVKARPPQLFHDYEDKTREATSVFSVLPECVYANKYMGATDPALECECQEEWDASTRTNDACGADSDCINRATKMECGDDCGCGVACQNQRFQRKQYANVSVIKTEKKGYGLRANIDLHAEDFIFEYIGEVIGENAFRKRMQTYDEEGIKHFYFMSLTKGEFVDATKKGNLGRFCNHSCNPNCYVDKWVVGDKLRMGIFAERKIQAGEELVFNYNVDRYGAEPQPCYCGEPNCTGYIGGKTQTERGTKLSNAIIEALGIDDADAWDTAVAKKPRKKKTGEDDEEYVNNVEPRGLDEEGVNKVMSSLMQCKEKWIAVKLLTRIQRADDEKVRNRVVRFHGYRILKTALSNFIEDVNLCLQIMDVLDKMPRLTRNKIQDSKIEETVQQLVNNEDERVASRSKGLLDAWAKLEIGYRIPRMKRDPNAVSERKVDRTERREVERRRSKSRSKSPDRIQAPTGPRSNAPQRAAPFRGPPPRFRPPPPSGALPAGWFEATAANGSIYYYNNNGAVTWQRPTIPAIGAPPPPPPKAVTDQQMISDLIANIVAVKKETPKPASETATPVETPKKVVDKEDRWKSWPIDKQKKTYEGVLNPHITHCMNKYKHKLPRDELKQWAKELGKKMVESDFKKGRVDNPTKISDKQVKGIKKHCYEFFDKAVKKKEEADKKKADKKAKQKDGDSNTPIGSPPPTTGTPTTKEDPDMELSGDEADGPVATPAESSSSVTAAKRRLDELTGGEADELIAKKIRIDAEAEEATAPPPPPPPPPSNGFSMDLGSEDAIPNEDGSDMLTPEAVGAMFEDGQAEAGAEADEEFHFKGAALPKTVNGVQQYDVTQTATPPFTGSPDEGNERAVKRAEFSGMNPDRMRQLGLLDGASE